MISVRNPTLTSGQVYDTFTSTFGELTHETQYIFRKKNEFRSQRTDLSGKPLWPIFIGSIEEFYAPKKLMIPLGYGLSYVQPIGRERTGDTVGVPDENVVPTQVKVRFVTFPRLQVRQGQLEYQVRLRYGEDYRILLSEYEFRSFEPFYEKILSRNEEIRSPHDLQRALSFLFETKEDNFVQAARFLTAAYPQGPELQITNLPLLASFLGLSKLGFQLFDEEAPLPLDQGVRGTLLRQRSSTGYVVERKVKKCKI
jgi:hypothetical protein